MEIESLDRIVVGVNKYQSDADDEVEVLDIDNTKVLKKQIERLKKVKKERNNANVKESLMNLEKAAQEDRNLLPYAIEAAKNRATLGEISLALEKVFGRYVAEIKIHGGLYGKIFNSEDEYEIVKIWSSNLQKMKADNLEY